MKKTNLKKFLAAAVAMAMTLSLTACGSSSAPEQSGTASESAKEYKVGIIKFMDHASLDQIETNIQKELDAKSAELGVNFNYKDYTANGQGDRTTLNQIAAQMVSGVLLLAVRLPMNAVSNFINSQPPEVALHAGLWFVILSIVVYNAVLYVINHQMLSKKLNLE